MAECYSLRKLSYSANTVLLIFKSTIQSLYFEDRLIALYLSVRLVEG
jgi:hypothetical protein